MGRTLDQVIDALPEERRQRVEARFQDLKDEVESLRELRRVTGRAQADIANTLKIKQPSVSKLEKQADMYLSTLRSYVEAVGGQLELVVHLPSRPPLRLRHLGDVATTAQGRAEPRTAPRTRRVKRSAPRA